jgi:hydroxyacylglutathione hydrolase
MIFRQITHDDLGCASYLIGDEDAGVAAVVDPKLDIEEYLALARYMGVRIEHILETHNHADHVSGHGRLAAATGAAIHIHRDAAPDYDHEPFDDGWELALGCVRVRALHTPGHRPEHTAFALIDTARGPEPWAALTGDTLFVGDIARPDLAVDKREGAQGIFRSLHDKLLVLPPACEVWPGHLGGSLCGGPGMDMKVSSTIGYERAHNALLSETDEDAFVQRTTSRCTPPMSRSSRSPRARSRPSSARAAWSWTSGPTCSSTTPTSPAPSATRRSARGSAPSWPGSPTASARSSWSAATTRTPCTRRTWPPPSGSRAWAAIWPAA